MKDITLTNISTATVILSMSDLRFRRELAPGRSCKVDEEIFKEMQFDAGINSLIAGHYILVQGVEEEVLPTETPVVDSARIAEILEKQDITTFAQFLPTAAQAEREAVVQIAIDKRIMAPAFVSLIKKYCGVDIVAAINLKHLAEDE